MTGKPHKDKDASASSSNALLVCWDEVGWNKMW